MTTMTWEQVATATGGADSVARVVEGVRRAYHDAGLTGPLQVIMLGSPAAGAAAAAWLTGDAETRRALAEAGVRLPALPSGAGDLGPWDRLDPGRPVREAVRTAPWERARAAAYTELGPVGWAALWAETGGRLWPQVDRLVGAVRRAIADLGGERCGEVLRRATLDAVLGQHDAPWLSAFDGLDGLKQVAETAGWWWPFERLAIVTPRPVELHRDESGRLHRADGPAMSFPDGFALHAWHGMPVPAGFGAAMSALTPRVIRGERNAELRRVMLEHFGIERYLAESGATPRHSDETGVLWQIELPGDEPQVMVEVVNSTPEPDGTRRTYFLRVPPWVRRARQGVAWTFGLNEDDYHPESET